MHPSIQTPFNLPVEIIGLFAFGIIILVVISRKAFNQADEHEITNRQKIGAARQLQEAIKRSGYTPETFYLKNTNIVCTVDYSNPEEPKIISFQRDQRYSKDGVQKLNRVDDATPETPRGLPLDQRQAKAAKIQARKDQQRQQSQEAQQRKTQNARPEKETSQNRRK